ncbi:periplasmic heavy metal sensor [Erythrobacter sp. NFXS35]|uniref:Spy/CpxP family protein refolding chaperone n=1 Tax=Erythrobacter sp. NFXS35 TaxID=2818436 RepID=UPI0032DF932C
MSLRRIAVIALIAFLAAGAGVFAARMFDPALPDSGAALHAFMHDELDLDPAQEQQLEVLEADFARRRATLEARLKADNARLAEAIAAEHVYGPRVSEAVDATHHSMGAVQKATLEHVFAMRAILRPDQQPRFDAVVDKALTAPAR